MGSMAMDQDGNIAVGYSASSTTVFPSIRYAGRLASDPLGQLAQGEATLFAGTGSQKPQATLGRLFGHVYRPKRRLHLLVHQRYYATTAT